MILGLIQWVPGILYLLQGNVNLNNNSLCRLFILHITIPVIGLLLIGVHIWKLHNGKYHVSPGLKGGTGGIQTIGSGNGGIGICHVSEIYMVIIKDIHCLLGILIFVVLLTMNLCYIIVSSSDNSLAINKLSTPAHIQPEWYFLYVYVVIKGMAVANISSVGLVLCMVLSCGN